MALPSVVPEKAPRPSRVCVAVATRNRPLMLRRLLDSLAKMSQPEGTEVHLVVVENGAERTLDSLIGEFNQRTAFSSVAYLLEEQLGIPYARNAALTYALNQGYDSLAFVDDDEVVDRHWLVALLDWRERHGLDLTGGPVDVMPEQGQLRLSQKWVLLGLRARAWRIRLKSQILVALGQQKRLAILTNNWLISLDFVSRHGLSFRNEIRRGGGSDVVFFRGVQSSGGQTGWCSGAVVIEEIPLSRLSPAYQFQRVRSQSMDHFHRKHPEMSAAALADSVVYFGLKGFALLASILLLLPTFGLTFLACVRSLAYLSGRVRALRGNRAEIYQTVQGS